MLKRARLKYSAWQSGQRRRKGQPLNASFWMLLAAGAAAAAIWFTTAWLLGVANDAPVAERAKTRVDAVRTGLAAGAGAGAAVGLMLAFRRQGHQEYDNAERRVTELYNAAAEQLGSDKAPVRMTALYTLERLAKDNEAHRQTIINIICAYLRMPYIPPEYRQGDERRRAPRRYRATRNNTALLTPPTPDTDPHEEFQVRLTAQRLLATHIFSNTERRWNDISLDLTGAALTDWRLLDRTINETTFTNTSFYGHTMFASAIFVDDVGAHNDFEGASFFGHVWFGQAHFSQQALFDKATFSSTADFSAVTFANHSYFSNATFSGRTWFSKATFSGAVHFDEASFAEDAHFSKAVFTGNADFKKAAFAGRARFNKATFAGEVRFDEATFAEGVSLEGATVANVDLEHVLPSGWRIEPAEGSTGRLVRDPASGST
ncbi:pentapeptide repeat-containing protein [Actinomadura algeriensis]|uniref:Uncharacterized protein YjbI with pentapeptide repeats n=1 Tax=Actinomadura algeriensis TaxID=1679523 RepID=A0ABR9JJ28_9ACTN|nr:pentapeptide repeat-containing protein [Actinomadura algeriensis]MBE1530386.1 uncharacterized protein YjbI with pentapeptide repeats [Actinomadura algeriensis]